MNTPEALLEESLLHCKQLLKMMEENKGCADGADPERILAFSEAIEAADCRLRTIDEKLAPFLEERPELSRSPLCRERMEVMEKIIALNETFRRKIKTVMVLKRDELQKIAGGRTIMDRYHSHSKKKGGLINTSK